MTETTSVRNFRTLTIPSFPYSAAQCVGVVPSFIGRLTSASRSTISLRRDSTLPAEAYLCIGELVNSVTDGLAVGVVLVELGVAVVVKVFDDAVDVNDELVDDLDETDEILGSTSRPAESGAETSQTK